MSKYQDQQMFLHKVHDGKLLANKLRKADDIRRQYLEYCFEYCQLSEEGDCVGCPIAAGIEKQNSTIGILRVRITDNPHNRTSFVAKQFPFKYEQNFVEDTKQGVKQICPATPSKMLKHQLGRYDEYCGAACEEGPNKQCDLCPIRKEVTQLLELLEEASD